MGLKSKFTQGAAGIEGGLAITEALSARPELLGSAGGADLRRRAVGITVTVESSDPVAAKAIAQRALEEVVAALGFAPMTP
jgi:hypothetical protein